MLLYLGRYRANSLSARFCSAGDCCPCVLHSLKNRWLPQNYSKYFLLWCGNILVPKIPLSEICTPSVRWIEFGSSFGWTIYLDFYVVFWLLCFVQVRWVFVWVIYCIKLLCLLPSTHEVVGSCGCVLVKWHGISPALAMVLSLPWWLPLGLHQQSQLRRLFWLLYITEGLSLYSF
jgi:hypothetical protein